MAEGSAPAAKICAACKKDVSSIPRTKDAQGRYVCKPCVEKLKARAAQAKPAQPKPAPANAVAPAEEDVMSMLLSDAPGVELCPNCGGGFNVGSKICIRCGYDKASGKAMKVQVETLPKERGEPSAAGKSFAAAYMVMADSPMGWLFAAGGALVGGLIGAGAYSYIMTSSGYEVFLVAVLIGFLAGVGGWLPVRWSASTSHGVIAAAVAMVCIIGGRYFAISQFADEEVERITRNVKVDDENMIAMVGRDVAKEFSAQGKNYQWPEESDPTTATGEADFPAPIWTEAAARFEKMDEAAKAEKRVVAERELRIAIQEFKSEAADSMFSESLNQRSTGLGFRKRTGWGGYIKWGLVGICVAFAVGSGFNNPFND